MVHCSKVCRRVLTTPPPPPYNESTRGRCFLKQQQGNHTREPSPCVLHELIGIAANVAKKLQEEGFVIQQFKKTIPIIIHGLECAWYDMEATQKANPNGEADTYIHAMKAME